MKSAKLLPQSAREDAPRLADGIADTLRGRILYGECAPGERISERKITEEFGVSRASARDALRILHMEGALEMQPNRGALVPQYASRLIEDTIEVVEYLEAAAGALACRRINEEQIDRIDTLTRTMQQALRRKDRVKYYQLNKQIHEAVVTSSGNSVLAVDYRKYNGRLYRTRFLPGDSDVNIASAMQEHLQIVKHLRRRDGAALSVLLANHLSHAWRRAGVYPISSQRAAFTAKGVTDEHTPD